MAGLNVQSEGKKILINNVGEYNRLFQDKYTENLNSLINKGNYILGDDVINFEKKSSYDLGGNRGRLIDDNQRKEAIKLVLEGYL